MVGLENVGKPIEFTEEVNTRIDINEMKDVIKMLEKGDAQIVKTEHLLRGNGAKNFGESYYIEYLYNCKICMHQRKDQANACSLDNVVHPQICPAFDKVV